MKKSNRISFNSVLIFATVILPLLSVLVLYPIESIITANIGSGILYQLLHYISQVLTVVSLFIVIALAVRALFSQNADKLGKIFAFEGLSLVGTFLVQVIVMLVLGFLDEAFPYSPIYFSDYTLSQLEDSYLVQAAIVSFISIVTTYAILAFSVLAVYITAKKARGRGVDFKILLASPTPIGAVKTSFFRVSAVYVIAMLISALVETVLTFVDYGTPATISDMVYIATPYIEIAIYTVIAYGTLYLVNRFMFVKKISS